MRKVYTAYNENPPHPERKEMNFFKSLFSHSHETPSTEDLTAKILETTNQMLAQSQR